MGPRARKKEAEKKAKEERAKAEQTSAAVGAKQTSAAVGATHNSAAVGAKHNSAAVGATHNSAVVGAKQTSVAVGAKHDSAVVGAKKTSVAVGAKKTSSSAGGACDVGVYGMAAMGRAFAFRLASNGISVCVGNRSEAKVDFALKRAKEEGDLPIVGSSSPEDFVRQLSRPRKIVILVQAGTSAVDDVIASLSPYIDKGDVVVGGGNEYFTDTMRRAEDLKLKGVHFMDMGISGGKEGEEDGPSLMPSGSKEAYDLVEPLLSKCAARVDDEPCTAYLGPAGSGNYVNMIQNAIENGDMQLISEVYDIMGQVLGMSNDEMAETFEEWNSTELESYLVESTAKILAEKDDVTGDGYLVDNVLDKAETGGTESWTVREAAERSVAAPTAAAALDARYIAARKEERVKASAVLYGPGMTNDDIPVDRADLIDDMKKALYASKVCSYAQGLGVIKAASVEMKWNVDLKECARVWKGGCFSRAPALMRKIQDALERDGSLPNLLLDPDVARELNERTAAWRRVVVIAIGYGVPTPALAGSLSYFDSYRTESLPANLTQAQRDFFGGHTYERKDRDGVFHCAWTSAHHSIGNINERMAGEL